MSNPFQSPQYPPQYPQQYPPPTEGDATSVVIPYKNVPALLAYYLGLLSLICCLFAVPFGIVPLVLGIVGLQRRAANPAIHGTAHAWIGIVLGGLNVVLCLAVLVVFLIALVSKHEVGTPRHWSALSPRLYREPDHPQIAPIPQMNGALDTFSIAQQCSE